MRISLTNSRHALALLSLAAMLGASPALVGAQLSPNGYFWLSEEERGSQLQLELTNSRDRSRNYSSTSFSIGASELRGLVRSQLESSAGGPLHFTLTREAGTFTFDGEVRGGQGVGTYAFAGDAGYADALGKRGYSRPDATEQLRLALGDVTLAFVDELKAQGYQQSTLADLARAGLHGVDIDYARDMRQAGYANLDADVLIRFRDHGVDAEFINELAEAGYAKQAPTELLRARDHGVTGSFIKGLKDAGYTSLTLSELVRLRDHGVTGSFARRMRERSTSGVPSAEDLVYAKNHSQR